MTVSVQRFLDGGRGEEGGGLLLCRGQRGCLSLKPDDGKREALPYRRRRRRRHAPWTAEGADSLFDRNIWYWHSACRRRRWKGEGPRGTRSVALAERPTPTPLSTVGFALSAERKAGGISAGEFPPWGGCRQREIIRERGREGGGVSWANWFRSSFRFRIYFAAGMHT